ncbi:MAG: glucose-6-phosphate dehydrogenase [Geminicoccaceae bacterium]
MATADRKQVAPIGAEPAPPGTLVVLGAGGDLAKRLLLPALYNLAVAHQLDDGFALLGVDHKDLSQDAFRDRLEEAVRAFVASRSVAAAGQPDPETWGWLRQRLHFLSGDFGDPDTYRRIAERLGGLPGGAGGRAVFYLATAPRFFGPAVEHLAAAGLVHEGDGGARRVVVEKPFGSDLASAAALNRQLLGVLGESQIYRMDHFLGKETVRNIMALRFGNGIFEPLWNRAHIDHVQITAAETVTVEERGRFYEQTGALRDMVPNHLFQLLAMVAMEAPNSFDADAVRTEKAKVVEAIRDLGTEAARRCSVRGQYRAGKVGDRAVPSYRDEPNVAHDSRTETYVALKLMVDNWRWADVPFYLRTGKALKARRTEIVIQFRQVPCVLAREWPGGDHAPNLLVLRIQPDEGLSLRFEAKIPGPKVRLSPVDMDFRYADYFQIVPSTGYETLLYDSLIGDPTLFQRADNIEAGWRAVQPFLDAWRNTGPDDVHGYAAGSWGPDEADALLARDGRRWLNET